MMLWSCLAPIAVVPPTQTLAHPPSPGSTLCCFRDFYGCILSSIGVACMDKAGVLLQRGGLTMHCTVEEDDTSPSQRFITGQGLRMSGCWVLSPTWDICSIPLRGHHGREDRKNKGLKGGYEFYEITQPSWSWWTHHSFSYPPRTCSRLGPSQGIMDRLHPFRRSCWRLVVKSNTSLWVQVWLFKRQTGYLSSCL